MPASKLSTCPRCGAKRAPADDTTRSCPGCGAVYQRRRDREPDLEIVDLTRLAAEFAAGLDAIRSLAMIRAATCWAATQPRRDRDPAREQLAALLAELDTGEPDQRPGAADAPGHERLLAGAGWVPWICGRFVAARVRWLAPGITPAGLGMPRPWRLAPIDSAGPGACPRCHGHAHRVLDGGAAWTECTHGCGFVGRPIPLELFASLAAALDGPAVELDRVAERADWIRELAEQYPDPVDPCPAHSDLEPCSRDCGWCFGRGWVRRDDPDPDPS